MKASFNTNRLIVAGTLILVVTIGGFGFWSLTMPLSSASVAQGNLVVESKRKQIQHLQGGWVKEVFVRDGDRVTSGQLLAELSDTKSESEHQRYLLRTYSLLAQQAWLVALLEDQVQPKWPTEVLDPSEMDALSVMAILKSEKLQFEQAVLKRQLIDSVYSQKLTLYQEKIRGNSFQRKAIDSQRRLISEEIEMTKGLVDKGYVSKTRMLELQRHRARVDAERAEVTVNIDVAKGELEALNRSYKTQLLEQDQDYSRQLAGIESELRDIAQVLRNLDDVRSRIEIRSEFDGTVVGLNMASVGGVVKPGQVLMEIVPHSDELIIEAVLSPKDIDVVRAGQQARVRLTAYSSRNVPAVLGEVVNVSADRVLSEGDANGVDQGYLVKIKFDRDNLERIKASNGIELYPGMMADVLILVEERTLWDYLIGPITSSLELAMREV